MRVLFLVVEDFFFKTSSKQLRRLFRRFRSLTKPLSFPWEKSCGDKKQWRRSLSARVESLSVETSSSSLKRESTCSKPSNTGAGSSSLCGTGRISESELGSLKEFLFFLLTPLVFTSQKLQPWSNRLVHANLRLHMVLFVDWRKCSTQGLHGMCGAQDSSSSPNITMKSAK